jgi:hypothetical protein
MSDNTGRPESRTTDIASGLIRGSGQARKPPPRPVPQDIFYFGNHYSLVQRIQCLTLITKGFSSAGIERKTGVKERLQRNIKKKARESEGFRLTLILAFLNIIWRMESDLVDRRRSLTKWRKVYWRMFEVVALAFSLASYAYL